LLAPRPTPKLEDHPSSAVHGAYSIYSQLKPLFLKITYKATGFSSIELEHFVVNVDFESVRWKGLMTALYS
jgi:hypothetical protein